MIAAAAYAGQPSSATTVYKTKLLDLPNELLSRIIDFLIPKPTIYPPATSQTGHESNIGLTCTRLFTIVKARLRVLDFRYHQSYTVNPAHRQQHISRKIEAFTRLSSPFLEVLILPQNFWAKDPALTTLGPCPHLTQLSLPVNIDLCQRGAEQFFASHRKLKVLELLDPADDVLAALKCEPVQLQQLTLVPLKACNRTLKLLGQLLSKMNVLESLSITFGCLSFGFLYHADEGPENALKSTSEVLSTFSEILQQNRGRLKVLHTLLLSKSTVYRGRESDSDADVVENMARQINDFGFQIDVTRLRSSRNRALKLSHLELNGIDSEDVELSEFMKHFVDYSCEVTVKFRHMKVSYPAVSDKGLRSKPIIRDLGICYDANYSDLMKCAEMKLESLRITTKCIGKQLTYEQSCENLLKLFHGNCLEAITIDYVVSCEADATTTMKLLRFAMTCSPNLTAITLPVSIAFQAEPLKGDDITRMECSQNIRMVCLSNKSSMRGLFPFLEDENAAPDSDKSFVAQLPKILDDLRLAFPKLQRLNVDRPCRTMRSDRETLQRTKSIAMEYERITGVDASSLRMGISHWFEGNTTF